MKFLQSQRGMALLTVLLAISTIALYTSMGLSRSTTENQAADFSVLTQQAFQLAEAGLDEAIWNFRQLPTPPQDINPHDPFTGLPCGSPGTERPLGSGRYSVCIDPDDNNPNPGLSTDYFDVTVTATVDGTNARRTIGAMLRSSSFTRFAVF
ncbi:MAG: hypothetical protein HYT88_02405, partial [Candidatus Omnitrophica bacterium]|nr:hypothetical protein [Candidatus Omnitrophota bacterium]